MPPVTAGSGLAGIHTSAASMGFSVSMARRLCGRRAYEFGHNIEMGPCASIGEMISTVGDHGANVYGCQGLVLVQCTESVRSTMVLASA